MRRRVVTKRFTCPNHPDGPPTLPADGYEREELTLEQAYTAEEIEALKTVVEFASGFSGLARAANTVEQMFGLCCAGHTWKVVSWRWMTTAEETIASVGDMFMRLHVSAMRSMTGHVLLKELDVPAADTDSAIRIPLHVGKQLPKSDAARAADEADRG